MSDELRAWLDEQRIIAESATEPEREIMLAFITNIEELVAACDWFLCDVLDWHRPDSCLGFDGASFTARCKRCKRRILKDSQGNWFAAFLQYDDGGDTP